MPILLEMPVHVHSVCPASKIGVWLGWGGGNQDGKESSLIASIEGRFGNLQGVSSFGLALSLPGFFFTCKVQ